MVGGRSGKFEDGWEEERKGGDGMGGGRWESGGGRGGEEELVGVGLGGMVW